VNEISTISTITDREAELLVSPETLAHLCEQITSLPIRPAPTKTRRPVRTRWLFGASAAVALAVLLALISTLGSGPSQLGPVPIGPGSAQALSFTERGGAMVVIIRNPLADPAEYRAEFAAHHLNIKLQMLPVSPSLVGAVVFMDTSSGAQITPITAVGKCETPGGGNRCPIGVRVPPGFHGSAAVAFGRVARPGEQYVSAGSATAPGEVMRGINYLGQTVATVLAELRARNVTVPQYRYTTADEGQPREAPSGWYVQGAIPWAPGQVLLIVSPTKGRS
jgi:hypothetical protein